MHFRLTYAGKLLATRSNETPKRAEHKHEVRKQFHKQLKHLWSEHPVLKRGHSTAPSIGSATMKTVLDREGFQWKPIVTEASGLICALDILLLRAGAPSKTIADLDNRIKTVFDALTMPPIGGLGKGTSKGKLQPNTDETPFYVLLEDDRLITHVSVTSDMLLEPVEGIPPEQSARLVISVTVRPYNVTMDNLDFA